MLVVVDVVVVVVGVVLEVVVDGVVVVEVVVVDVVLPVIEVELVIEVALVDVDVDVELVEVDDVVNVAGPKVRVYDAMFVAACWPGTAKFPVAKPISIGVPAARLVNGSYGEALPSLKGR